MKILLTDNKLLSVKEVDTQDGVQQRAERKI